jgi:hypothetical protein
MRRKLLLAVLGALAVAVVAAVVWMRAGRPAASDDQLDPALDAMLQQPARGDFDHGSLFFTALSSLAEQHGAPVEDYIPDWFLDEGFAARVGPGYVVAVLRGEDHEPDGTDRQHLLLLDRQGHLLDRLSCGVGSRLTRAAQNSGTFLTDVADRPEEDGARLIIRYIPPAGGGFPVDGGHEISHGGKTRRFRWGEEGKDALRPAELDEKGLCRVAVRDGKLAVLFPDLREGSAGD